MKGFLKFAAIVGLIAGAVVAYRQLSGGQEGGEEAVQITFDDGSVHSLSGDSVEGQQFADIARKLVQVA